MPLVLNDSLIVSYLGNLGNMYYGVNDAVLKLSIARVRYVYTTLRLETNRYA